MKNRLPLCGASCVALCAIAPQVHAVDYRYVRIADSRDGLVSLLPDRHAAINSAGTVVFGANAFPGVTNGYYSGVGGPVSTIVTGAHPELDGFALYAPSLNDSGQIAFYASRETVDGFRIYRATPAGALTLIATTGTGTFQGIQNLPTINNSGNVAFLEGGVFGGAYIGNGSSNAKVYGFPDDVQVLGGPSLNNVGTLSFPASLSGTGLTHLKGAGGTPVVIASTAEGVSLFAPNVINDSGLVVFGAFANSTQGIYSGAGGSSITPFVTIEGPYSNLSLADGTGAGGFPSLNNAGTIAFVGALDAGGDGIFTGSDPTSSQVIGGGTTLFGRTVVNFFGGLSREALNDAGEIAFQAQLIDVMGPSEVVVKAIPYTAQKWSDDSDGTWSDVGNWIGPVPNAFHHDANFTDAITAPRTVTVDGAFTVGSMNFNNVNSYKLVGPGSITLNESTGGGNITASSGSHSIGVNLTSAKTNLRVGESTTLRVEVSGLSGLVVKDGAGTFQVNRLVVNDLKINEGMVQVLPNGSTTGTSRTTVLNLAGAADAWTSVLDLNDNDLVIDHDGSSTEPFLNTRNQIKSGHNGGSWTGKGITSSLANSTTLALGYADNSVLGLASFSGQSVDTSSVLVKYTYYGDSDLNGKVDVADLGNLASNWQSSAFWTGGDFDYNGSVDVNDLGLLASNWQAGVGSPLGPSFGQALASFGLPSVSVPEPAGVGLVLAVALTCRRRRRRRV